MIIDIIEIETNKNTSCNNIPDTLSLARAYVLLQKFTKIYPMCEALNVGTVFPELDLRYKKPDRNYKPQRVCYKEE